MLLFWREKRRVTLPGETVRLGRGLAESSGRLHARTKAGDLLRRRTMERMVAGWALFRWLRRPATLGMAVACACLPWLAGAWSGRGVSSYLFIPQDFMSASSFLLGLLGAAEGLAALQGIEVSTQRLLRRRAWRVRLAVLGANLAIAQCWLLFPALALRAGSTATWATCGLALLWIAAVACAIDAGRLPAPRSIFLLVGAWWIPALSHAAPTTFTALGSSAPGAPGTSPAWTWIGPILALALAACGLDLLRRPSA